MMEYKKQHHLILMIKRRLKYVNIIIHLHLKLHKLVAKTICFRDGSLLNILHFKFLFSVLHFTYLGLASEANAG